MAARGSTRERRKSQDSWMYKVYVVKKRYCTHLLKGSFMQKPGLKNRLITGSVGFTLLLGMLASAFFFSAGTITAHAATRPSSHSMSVHPIYRYAGKANNANPNVT